MTDAFTRATPTYRRAVATCQKTGSAFEVRAQPIGFLALAGRAFVIAWIGLLLIDGVRCVIAAVHS